VLAALATTQAVVAEAQMQGSSRLALELIPQPAVAVEEDSMIWRGVKEQV
jgi:hypothetical protein